MKPELSQSVFWAVTAIGVAGVLVLAGLTFQSLFRLFGPQPAQLTAENAHSAPSHSEASERGDTSERALPVEEGQAVADTGEHPAASPLPAGQTALPVSIKHHDFSPDFKAIREQEKGRRELIEKLRQQTRENPGADNIPSEEQLKKIEESGADFL